MMLRMSRLALLMGCVLVLAVKGHATAKDKPKSHDADEWIYTVQPGDTLSQIASQTLGDLAAWRQLQTLNHIANPNRLTPGSTLRIPSHGSQTDLAQAEALSVSGGVTVSRGVGTASNALISGTVLKVGSTIETGEDGLVTLRFADQSRMLVSPNSRLTLTSLQFNRGAAAGITRTTLEKGNVESQVNPQKGAGARYEIKTASANFSVRGTTFRVQLDGKTGLTRSSVLEGAVQASNNKGSVNIGQGYGSVITPGHSPGVAQPLLPPPTWVTTGNPIEHFPARFDWQDLKDSQQYRVDIVEVKGEERLVQTLITRDPRSAWTALPNGDYRIRVRGIAPSGLEGRDALFGFKVEAWPAAPMVNAPLEGAVVAGERISFRWARVSDAEFLRFQIARDPGFQDIAMQVKSLTVRSGGIAVPLTPGRYYWRIASGRKREGLGPFGPAQAFEVGETPRGAASNRLRWQVASPGERFKIQVATHESFGDPLIDREQVETEVALPEVAQTVYVRVKRIARDGFPGEFEPVQTFERGR